MKLITATQRKALIKNHLDQNAFKNPKPVVKMFAPWGAATWLFTELDPEGDILFGLCDLGHGFPELGYISLSELASMRGPIGLKIERDMNFEADKTLHQYASEASKSGRIAA